MLLHCFRRHAPGLCSFVAKVFISSLCRSIKQGLLLCSEAPAFSEDLCKAADPAALSATMQLRLIGLCIANSSRPVPGGPYRPRLMTSLEKPILLYSSWRLNFAVTTPMLPVMVRGSATMTPAPIAM